jgi:hypothetical protein
LLSLVLTRVKPTLTLTQVPRKLFWVIEPPRIKPAFWAKPTLAVIEPEACSSLL